MELSRRRLVMGAAVTCGGLMTGVGAASANAKAGDSGMMGSRPIHQEEDFSVGSERIYGVLLDAKQFHDFTGEKAQIDPGVGGAFSLFDDRIVGRHIELVPNQRVVQAWREPSWGTGIYSIVRFELKAQGSGTRIVFDHWGFPEEGRSHLTIGWKEHYWEPMRKYFAR